jgi:hypothetical protein
MQMMTRAEMVTPSVAATWLQQNAQHQRRLRKSTVDAYAQQMKAGQWELTHQGIAFDVNGALIDGQHRLAAVVQANVTVPMLITTGAPVESFGALDCGATRSLGDRLSLSSKICAGLSTAIQISKSSAQRVGHHEVHALHQTQFGQVLATISDANNTSKKVFSSAPVLVAAAVACFEGEDIDWVIEQRRVLIAGEEISETPVAAYFRRRFTHYRVINGALGNLDLLACALRVFDSAAWFQTKMQISDEARKKAMHRVRDAVNNPTKEQ